MVGDYTTDNFRISIHAPREGGDLIVLVALCLGIVFQSTPPARGATLCGVWGWPYADISIHAPREGGDFLVPRHLGGLLISIHAPREGGDKFQPNKARHKDISIHAPREGGDQIKG